MNIYAFVKDLAFARWTFLYSHFCVFWKLKGVLLYPRWVLLINQDASLKIMTFKAILYNNASKPEIEFFLSPIVGLSYN